MHLNGIFEFKGNNYNFILHDFTISFYCSLEEKDAWFRFAQKEKYRVEGVFNGINADGNRLLIFVDKLLKISSDKLNDQNVGKITLGVEGVINTATDVHEININKIHLAIDANKTQTLESNADVDDDKLLEQWFYCCQRHKFIYISKTNMSWKGICQKIGLIINVLRFIGQKDILGNIQVDFFHNKFFVGNLSNCKLVDGYSINEVEIGLINILSLLNNDNIATIIQRMDKKQIYMAHISQSIMPKIVNTGWFLTIMAAFEWEYRDYDFSDRKSQEAVIAQKNILSAIDSLIEKNSGKIKKHLKSYRKLINNIDMNMAEKLSYIFSHYEKKNFLEPLAHELYFQSYEEYSRKEDIALRLQKQRNDFAHGNLDQDIQPVTISDITLVRKILYIMQLDKCKVESCNIEKCYETIFGMNPFEYFRSYKEALRGLEKYIKTTDDEIENEIPCDGLI